jgi:hypothetical protein
MINFTADCNEDLERTQRLPVVTVEVQLDEALRRERAARIEIVELLRQNLQQATTEERLFEVCGALRNALAKILDECQTRSVALRSARVAHEVLERCCDELEQVLSVPGFSAPAAGVTAAGRARAP